MNAQLKDTTYNGWSNYETWLVKLWIDNEQGDYEYWREQTQELLRDIDDESGEDKDEYKGNAATQLSDRLKDSYEEAASDKVGTAGVFADLIGAALSRVDWREIAEAMISDEQE